LAERIGELAWNALTEITRSAAEKRASEHSISEAVRLGTLNGALSAWTEDRQVHHVTDSFVSLSYAARRAGADEEEVSGLLDGIRGPSRETCEKIASLDTASFVELLGQIHSMGCYRLPLGLNAATYRRNLGAYYTPQAMADFITSSTLEVLLGNRSSAGSLTERVKSFTVLDPACGTGTFLLSAYRHLRHSLENVGAHVDAPSSLNRDLVSALYGVDLDEGALEVARVSLVIVADSRLPANDLNLRQGNSLISLGGLGLKDEHNRFFSDLDNRMPFEWSQEFGGVLGGTRRGFDCVLMNPPYERLKPNLAEFMRERLLSGAKKTHTEQYENYRKRLSEEVRYYRQSGEYAFSNTYTLNMYQLFIERSLQLSRVDGAIGCIVPSAVLGDLSAQSLRRHLLGSNRLLSVFEFPESSRVFQGVTQSVSVLVLLKGGSTGAFTLTHGLQGLDNLESGTSVRLSSNRLATAIGPSLVIPRLSSEGWRILDLVHSFPRLAQLDGAGVWRGELDLTLNKDCISGTKTEYPLVRGSNVSRFRLANMETGQFADIRRLQKQLSGSARVHHSKMNRIATQQISNMNQRWRLKCAHVPPAHTLANSCNYIVLNDSKLGHDAHWYLLGVLNSELMNWRFHLSSYNNHVSIRELKALPIASPQSKEEKRLQRLIAREAKALESGAAYSSTRLEASVFALYDLNPSASRHVLKSRGALQQEIDSILAMLD
jgi:adenine-specific DNA-methyltransferase